MKITIVKAIKAIFSKPARSSSERSEVSSSSIYRFDFDAYITKNLGEVQQKALKLTDIYGSDFNAFFIDLKLGRSLKKNCYRYWSL